MYERAVLRKPVGKTFGATVDLWSIGVSVCNSSDAEREDANNNSDERWNTIDEVGYTDVPANDDKIKHDIKGQVDLDKIIIKKRNK